MAAPKKNSFWKARAKSGRDKIFSSSDELYNSASEYFDWCNDNPLKEEKAFGTGLKVTVSLMRPFTLTGLLLFLDVDENTWQRYRKEEPYKDFWAVIKKIDSIIYTQKFEGAAVGLLNPNIIARDLGLSEKVDSKNTNINYNSSELTPERIKEIEAALENEV
jgi:hypothetical protein